ncbi:MAG TPA: hypothetical protein VFX49_06195 [Chloroflexota bacterium]|nr:hypothetical protein [Chloroflexota bacterium]
MNTHTTATADMARLRAQGFSPQGAARLAELRRRHARGDLTESPIELKRLEFACWLVEHGRLSDQTNQMGEPPGATQELPA